MTDNVTPIAPTDPPCASCGAVLRTADRFDPEKHDERCRQPEIRMRRAEGEVAHLKDVLLQLVAQGNETVNNQIDLNNRLKRLEGNHGSSEAIPDTQRSGASGLDWSRAVYGTPARTAELHPDSSPTEPSGTPDPGADATDT